MTAESLTHERARRSSKPENPRPLASYKNLSPRDHYFYLLNIERFVDFRSLAKALTDRYLLASEQRLAESLLPEHLSYFDYDAAAFDKRLQLVLDYHQQRNKVFDLNEKLETTNRQKIIQALVQFAPVNLVDGAWLRNIERVRSNCVSKQLLNSIWDDESGKRNQRWNHASIYRRLLKSVGVQLPDVNERQFVDYVEFDEASFINPVFQLAVSLFPDRYFPELLGMTLFYEWEASISILPVIRLLEHRQVAIDASFFKLHVEVDNTHTGHGALAKRAVQDYLCGVATQEKRQFQALWRRIWNGYAAFATTGTQLTRCDYKRTKCKGWLNL